MGRSKKKGVTARSAPFSHLARKPQTYRAKVFPTVPVQYVVAILRNQRIKQHGGMKSEPILSREFLVGDEWQELISSLGKTIHALGDIEIRFIGDGVDPMGTNRNDQEALNLSQSAVIVAEFEGDRVGELRQALRKFLDRHDLDNCWVLHCPGDLGDVVVRR